VTVVGALVLVMLMAIGVGSGLPIPADAAEPPVSLVPVASATLAASIVIRAPLEEDIARSVPVRSGDDERWLTVPSPRRPRVLGAGVIVDPRGLALTSARIVRLVPGFEVTLIDGTPVRTTVVGLDSRSDVALLKLHREAPLPYLALGDSDRVEVGDWVIAIGAPSGLAGTVSAGIITATPTWDSSSPVASFLQTDAAMARGNAGGPIVAMTGEVVGLGTVLRGDGIGYALPARTVRKIYLELLEKGRVSRPWLGVTMQSLTADLARAFGVRVDVGVLVTDVLPRSPAAGAGLRSGDILVEVSRTAVSTRAHVERVIHALAPGETVRLKVRRNARELVVAVKLGEEPDEWELVPALSRAKRLLGIDVRPITPTMGVVVVEVEPESPAQLVGIESGDVVREVDRLPVRNIADFQAIARTLRTGAEVLLLVQRADVALYVVLSSLE
jgi:S1-C subfamily serine protease